MADYDPSFDLSRTSEGPGGFTGHAEDPNYWKFEQAPAGAPAPSLPNVPAPGNDANQIQGWASKFLGRNFSDNDISGLAGQPLDLVMHNIANSPEAMAYAKGQGVGQPPAAQQSAGGGTFSDPASAAWEKLLNQRISQLQTPYQNPGFDQAIGQLNTYLQRLNGPAYTPDQMSVMQTQALDPLEQQRSATHQQIIQRMAGHGIGPGSGILEKALEDADQQFNQLRTKTQSGFATQAIGQSNQNAQLAAQLAPFISQMYQGQFDAQDARNAQAANMAGVIPQTAWSRLTGANGMVQQQNPLAALQLMSGFQNQGYGQSADFSNGLMQLISLLFGAGH